MESLIERLLALAPAPLRRLITPDHTRLFVQFAMFGTVGLAGFVVDTATVYGLRAWLGLYGAGMAAYITAATVTWLLNRVWTFRGQGGGSIQRQWARFLAANALGFLLNRGTYAVLVTFVAAAAEQPVIATFAGAIAGMFVNFHLSRRMVFR